MWGVGMTSPAGADTQYYVMPSRIEIDSRLDKLVADVFRGHSPAPPGRRPSALVTMGVQGAGKSTAIRRLRPRGSVLIDPDHVTNVLLKQGPLPDDGPVFSLADVWTHKLLDHALRHRYDLVYDTALPSRSTLAAIKRRGFFLKVVLVHTVRGVARERETRRDLARGWGRVGISLRSHRATRDSIRRRGPGLVRRFADELTTCDNSGRVMRCEKCPLPLGRARELFSM